MRNTLKTGLLGSSAIVANRPRWARGLAIAPVAAALIGAAALSVNPARAQSVLEAPPPTHYSLDPRGVDVITGKVVLSTVDVSIGDPSGGGLTYARNYIGSGWRDSVTGAVDPFVGGVTVSIGGQSEEFRGSGSTFTPIAATGSTLSRSGNLYTYRTRDGMTAVFSTAYSSYIGQARGHGIISLTNPNGEKLTYDYTTVTVPKYVGADPVVTASRLETVTSNTGYRLTLAYALDDPPTTTWLNQFLRVTGVTGSNLATGTGPWPYATYATGVVNRNGITTSYGFGSYGVTSIRRPTSTTDDVVVTYDSSGRVSTWSDNGNTWTYAYSASGSTLTTTVTNPQGKAETYVSNASTRRLTSHTTYPNYPSGPGLTTSYLYDVYGRLTRATLPEGNYTQYAYDSRGNVTTTTNVAKSGSGLANLVATANFPSSCSNPVTCNRPTATTDALGRVTNYTYDSTHGGVLTVTEPAPVSGAARPQTRFTYQSINAWSGAATPVTRLTQISQCVTGTSCNGTANEVRTTLGYSGANGMPTQVSTGSGNGALTATTTLTYTPYGDVASVNGPLSGSTDTTTYRYDIHRRIIGAIGPDPDGTGSLKRRAIRNTYNLDGQITLAEQGTVDGLTDANWTAFSSLRKVATAYDAWGRPTHQRLQSGSTTHALTQVSYDAAGRQDCVTVRMNPATFASPPASACTAATAGTFGPDRITRNGYDAASRLTSVISGYGTSAAITESATYSNNGQPLTLTDGKGNVSTFVYDGFDRVSRLRFPNASGGGSSTTDYETYTYDAASNVTAYRNRAGQTINATYDALNRMTLLDAPTGTNDVAYTYDLLGRPLTAVSGGQTMTQAWDALGRMTSETGPRGTYAFQYDLANRRTRITWPDGFYAQYTWDLGDEITRIGENGATSGVGVLAAYTYDNLGRRTGVTRGNAVSTSYAYDGAGRLTSLAHDAAGTANDVTLGFTYNPASQVATRTMSNSLYAYAPANGTTSYVNNGRNEVTSAGGASITYDANRNIASDGTRTYGYDAFSRLTNAGGMAITYDPAGQIYGLGSNSLTHIDGGPGALYTSAGAVSRRFVPGATQDETAAYYMGPAVTDRRYIIADNLNSSMGVTTASGGVSGPNTYDEYGNPGANNTGYVQFTGQFALPGDLPLYSYKNRVYHQALGRFLQTDPIGYGDGANMYAYVGNDPINWVDPSGTAAQYTICLGNPVFDDFTGEWAPGTQTCSTFGGGGWGNGWQSCGRACYEELTGGGRNSIYDAMPGGGIRGSSIRSDPQYAPFQAAYQSASRENSWMLVPVAAAVAAPIVLPPLVEGGLFALSGRELVFGRNFRIAPFGNRTPHPLGRWPHYHRRGLNADGTTRPGQGVGRHRPWERRQGDKNFWDRF